MGSFIRRVIPYVNFLVASSALCFQFFVLYPWHNELDKDFRKLQEDHHLTLEEYHQKKIKRLEEIEQNILRLEAYHHRNDEPKAKQK